jgi:PIN domain nuclease of toxin-antitoxin system
MVLLDTCALLWWTLDPGKLSPAAARACDSIAETGGLCSSISIWEVGIKVKRGKLVLPLSLEEYLSRLRRVRGLEVVPVDASTWLENLALPWEHRDPADRTIVATAKRRNLPIVTKDSVIAAFYHDVIW